MADPSNPNHALYSAHANIRIQLHQEGGTK
jgi:hypothetical protein